MPEENRPEFVKKDLAGSNDVAPKKKAVRRKKAVVKSAPSPVLSKTTEKRIQNDLKQIYQNDDGSMPNMSDFQKKRKRSRGGGFFTFVLACLFFGAVAWAGFFYLQPQSKFKEQDVVLAISGNTEVKIGQEVSYRVRYQNSQNVPLSKVVLQVKYPRGFVLSNASKEPTNEKKDEWQLGSLSPQESGFVDLVGKIYGDLEDRASFRAFLNYVPSNFNSEFQKVANLNVLLTDAPVDLAVSAPVEVVANVPVDLIINIKKQTADAVGNIALVVEPGKLFTKISSIPESDKDNLYQWSMAAMPDDQEIKLRGNFVSEDATEAEILVKVIGWQDETHDGDPFVLRQEVIRVKLVKAEINTTLAINGSMKDGVTHPGEVLNITIALKNSGQSELKNIRARLFFETPSVDKKSFLNWLKIEDPADGDFSGEQINEETRRGIIVWDKKKIKDLAVLAPGKDTHIDLSIPLKEGQATDLSDFKTFLMTAVAEISYENGVEQKTLSSNKIALTINSDLVFSSDDQIKANSQDKEEHNLTWKIENSFHELKDIELSADIYGDVFWDASKLVTGAGEAKFDPQTKHLIWKVAKMPVSVDVLALKFGFVLNTKNPTQTELISKVSVKATDTVTGQEITLEGDATKL